METTKGHIKVPFEMYTEIDREDKDDLLKIWITDAKVNEVLVLGEEIKPEILRRVFDHAYATDLTEDELNSVGKDPFLLAYALADADERVVVTNEVSKPKRLRGNRKIPDAYNDLSIKCVSAFELNRQRNFQIPM